MARVDPLRRSVAQLSRLPGIGDRTATRLVYWLLRQDAAVALDIASALQDLHASTTRCSLCCDVVVSDPCPRCSDPRREDDIICVVERPQDIGAIERSGGFRGRFHVLGGSISPLDGVGPDSLNVRELLARLENSDVKELLIATDPDVEGDATALYLASLIKPSGKRVTRIAHGVAVGTELEYADRSSVARALENRREL